MTDIDWGALPCVAFDLETTGVNPHADRIVQAAVVKIIPGQDPVTKMWLVDPGIEIPDGAAAIHGITTERARAEATHNIGQMLFEVSGILARAMGSRWPVVIMNAAYDVTMLEAENARHGEPTLASRVAPLPIGPIIDPMVCDRKVDKYRPGSRKLVDLAEHYGVDLTAAHDAGADALAAGLIWPAIVRRYPDTFRGLTVGGLHVAQASWKREQADGLRSFWKRKGDERWREVQSEWPLLPTPVETAELQGSLL